MAVMISVIVPSFNKVRYLRECLLSIQCQTINNWECIVVDDCSPAGEVISSVVNGMCDRRFRIVRHTENRGPAAARNTGAREARGQYLVFVDEDDRILPHCIERLMEELKCSGGDIVAPQAKMFGGQSGVRRSASAPVENILTNMHLVPNGWIISKECFFKNGGYDEAPELRGREDWEWWIRVITRNVTVRVVYDQLYEYRKPGANYEMTTSLNIEARGREVSARKYIIKKHYGFYRNYPDSRKEFLRDAYRTECEYFALRGQKWRSLLRLWCAYLVSKKAKDLKDAIRKTVEYVSGGEIVALVRAIRKVSADK